MSNIVQFHDHKIELINHNGQAYMTLSQIASVLEYNNNSSINDILSRNCSEFDEEMSCLIKRGRTRVRIFNREGAWLIGMFARTPKAAEFRKWVLKVLGAVADGQQADKSVIVSEHTRALPSGKKEIVLSEKAKTEIGGIVKSCVAFAVREELAAILSGCGKTEYWEVSDRDLLYQLYHWHATKNKKDTLEFRRLHAENDRLVAENADLKNRMSQISSWIK